jgi:hypothetical protein
MATQVGADLATLFRDPRARARVDLSRLVRPGVTMSTLKYVLYQATAGAADPRPRFAVPVPPPPGVDLASLRPGLMLEGRVVRALGFGVFVDVGLGAEALIPLPHVGDRPGLDPAAVAPVGAVVHGRVLDVDVAKKRITLTMRPMAPVRDARPGGPGQRPARGPRRGTPDRGPPRGPAAPASERPGGERPGGERPAGERPRAFGPDAPRRGARPPRTGQPSRDRREEKKPPVSFSSMVRPTPGAGGDRRPRRDEGRRPARDDPGAPRRISLPADAPAPAGEAPTEGELTPEQVMAKKLEELKRRLARPE